MQDDQINPRRPARVAHWASALGEYEAEHDIYADAAVCYYPQCGERIPARRNLRALRTHHSGRPSGVQVKRILGGLWVRGTLDHLQGRASRNAIFRRAVSRARLA
jgi:hypothetical protein